jgi:hypothetical protein
MTSLPSETFYNCYDVTNVSIPDTVTNIGTYAFYNCDSLQSITIPGSVTSIDGDAFVNCYALAEGGIYFSGNAPTVSPPLYFTDSTEFAIPPTVYFLPGTAGWGPPFSDLPAVLWNGLSAILWNPQAQTGDGFFGVRTNRFGFNITGTSNVVCVVEACTDLANPTWQALGTYKLTGNPLYFSDPQWTNYPGRCYRIRSP